MSTLYVISGPSGAGMKEIVSGVIDGRDDVVTIIPVTSRRMKVGEVNGIGYWFYDLETWSAMRESGDLLEETELAGNDYGTSRKLVMEQLNAGKSVIIDMEPDRALRLKQSMPESVTVYVEPASEKILKQRFAEISHSTRETDVRMQVASEMRNLAGRFDRRVNSDDLAKAEEELRNILLEFNKNS